MSKVEFRFRAWGHFFAALDDAALQRWLEHIGIEAVQAFRRGMLGPHSGQVTRRKGGGTIVRSAPNEYPANETGRLLAGTKLRVTRTTVAVGSNVPHATFLIKGTKYMAKRKMYREAIQEGIISAADNLDGFAKWKGLSRWKDG